MKKNSIKLIAVFVLLGGLFGSLGLIVEVVNKEHVYEYFSGENILILLELISSIGTFISIVVIFIVYNGQVKWDMFTYYTQRYNQIMEKIPYYVFYTNKNLNMLTQEEKDNLMPIFKAYFDLYSEEFYVKDKKSIDIKVWDLWREGMKTNLRREIFKSAFIELKKTIGFYEAFEKHIETLINENDIELGVSARQIEK